MKLEYKSAALVRGVSLEIFLYTTDGAQKYRFRTEPCISFQVTAATVMRSIHI